MAKRVRGRGRSCIASGYVYRFEGKRNWRASSNERWETIMHGKTLCGRKVGERTIDGSHVVVVSVGGRYYAALPHAVKKGP